MSDSKTDEAPTRLFLMARAPQPVAPAKIAVQLGAHGWTARDAASQAESAAMLVP